MSMEEVLSAFPVIPVCGLASPADAEPLGEALRAGGLPIIEVTLRTPDALESLAAMAKVDGVLVGAGTVRTAAQLDAALDAGAAFIVSPCLTPTLARAAIDAGVPFLPGATTPSEIQTAVDAGFDTVKFFPAEALGGLPVLSALAEVFRDVTFVPTGGISATTFRSYLAHPQIPAVGGSWMVPAAARAAGDWAAVSAAVAACVTSLQEA